MQLRILVVEDDPLIASLLATELSRLGHAVKVVANGQAALASAASWSPSLMLLDLGLPDVDGAEVLRQVRQRGDALPVICLTARDSRSDRIAGLRGGADDYMVKPFDVAELEARIQAIMRRTGPVASRELVVGGLRLAPDGVQITPEADGPPLALTPRELHVLRRLLRNAGHVVTKAQFAETLSALNEDIGDKTIEVYIHRIRGKIRGHGVEIVTVRGFGYLLRATPSTPRAPTS